jgi:hypothetical protein
MCWHSQNPCARGAVWVLTGSAAMGSHRCAIWIPGGFAPSVMRDRLMRSSAGRMISWCRDMCCLNLISVVPGVLKADYACGNRCDHDY